MIAPLQIDPAGIYDDGIALALGVQSTTLARARREGRLRFSRQGRRTLYLGQWLLDWVTKDSALLAGKGDTTHV